MVSTPPFEDRATLGELVKQINQAWRSGQLAVLNELFHEDLVIVGPGFQPLAKGRAACVASYEEFLRTAKVCDYREAAPTVDLFEDTAMVTYGWEMTYALAGQTYRETGHDAWAFSRHDDRWRAVWRAMMPSPSATTS